MMPMEKNFNAAEAEARISAKWIADKAFRAGANAKPGHPAFSVMIPPPNVTGSLHMGHIFTDLKSRFVANDGYIAENSS